MLVDAFGVSFGALMGTSTITAYVESAAGIGEGGRTGLTAVTTGLLFLLALVLAPLATLIPNAATAPALIIVGLLMVSAIKEIDFEDFTEGPTSIYVYRHDAIYLQHCQWCCCWYHFLYFAESNYRESKECTLDDVFTFRPGCNKISIPYRSFLIKRFPLKINHRS